MHATSELVSDIFQPIYNIVKDTPHVAESLRICPTSTYKCFLSALAFKAWLFLGLLDLRDRALPTQSSLVSSAKALRA